MQLRRIEIRNFRKLDHAVIDDLGDGLSVVVGDNEAGKSTVLAALRAVLFERHSSTGKHIERMLPFRQIVRPEVKIDFDLQGSRFTLRKAFHQRPEAELVVGGERLAGDAVEERLADLFRFTPPGRGESKREEHQGLYGLLWVDQGHAHGSLGVGGGRETLASAFENEIGQLVGGERGRALLAAAAERREIFWGRNDKPRGAYRQAAVELDKLEARRREVAESLRDLDDKVALLASKQEALARHEADDRPAKAAETVRVRRAAVDHLAGLERIRDEVTSRRDHAAQDCLLATERRQRRREMIAKVDAAEADVDRRLGEAREARRILAHWQGLAETDRKRHDESRRARLDAETALRLGQEALARRRRSEALVSLERRLGRAEAHASARREIRASVAGIGIDAKRIVSLEALQRAADQDRAKLDAASVQIIFAPEHGRGATLDGGEIPTSEPLRLSRDGVLALQGFGHLTVRPGGGVDLLARTAEEAKGRLDDALREVGCPSLGEAREAVAKRREAEAAAAAEDKLLAAVAPEGLDGLRQAIESERAALSRIPPDADIDASEAGVGALQRHAEDLRQTELGAEATALASLGDRDRAARDLAIADDRVATARAQLESLRADLASARAQATDSLLGEREATTASAVSEAEGAVARAAAGLAALDPELLRLDLERAESAERVIRADIDRLKADRRDLEVELGAMGQAGFGEELAALDGAVERLRRDKVSKDLEAEASRLLHDTLTEAQRESKDRWLGPVRERVKPYLRFLEPDADVVLNEETLEIEGLLRRGIAEPFGTLSMGAREQVAVITRLALADILRTSGRASVLILDDALVNTDAGRLERMHRVLQTAAKTLQVLVLTCRERDFVGLGDLKRL